MLLLGEPERRSRSQNLALGGTTAIAAGMVNVASVMAFFGFSSNVTGHVAIFTQELSEGRWHQVTVVLGWLASFLTGAFLANTLVQGFGTSPRRIGRVLAPTLEILLLLAAGYYCQHHYAETLRETEALIALLLLAMGLQNGTVASVSGGVVKTTHLTGLFTDLGIELAMLVRGELHQNAALGFKLHLHLAILGGYVLGGVVGGLVYARFGYVALLLAAGVLASVLVHDLVLWWRAEAASRHHVHDPRPDGSGHPSPPPG